MDDVVSQLDISEMTTDQKLKALGGNQSFWMFILKRSQVKVLMLKAENFQKEQTPKTLSYLPTA